MSPSEHYFGKRRRFSGKLWWLTAAVITAALLFMTTRPPGRNVIEDNQEQARQGLAAIARALEQWKTGDYDANGRADYPLGPLENLEHTTFINGQSLDILDHELARADMRNSSPRPYHGYLFTLFTRDSAWPPAAGPVADLLLYATPVRPGKTGACTFMAELNGRAWYSNRELPDNKPHWPANKEFTAQIWVPIRNLW